jgi:ABC-2 type transport system ATP-binding protein
VTAGALSPGPADGVAVRARDVRKSYGARPILTGVSFEVQRGELFALLGPNGAGKTTTVEILEGYRKADGGEVSVLGLDPAKDGGALRPRIGLMLQEGGIDNRSTPREVLRLYAKFYRDPEDPDALLEAVDLGRAAATRYRRLCSGCRSPWRCWAAPSCWSSTNPPLEWIRQRSRRHASGSPTCGLRARPSS